MGNEKVFEMEEVLELQKTENIANEDAPGISIVTFTTYTITFTTTATTLF